MLEERELVRRVVAGDPAAEEEFLRAYRARLTRASCYIPGAKDREAVGVVQDALVAALPQLRSHAFYTPIYAWLRQICLRMSYARLRARRRLMLTLEEAP
jgi:DNA-directed RNA polymerase specialized sigma24 family protein